MVYNEFLETMKKQMELALGDGYSLTLRKVQKNNSLILDGLCIEKDGSPVAPSIYLNPFYEHYLDGVSLETITKKLLTAYHENSYPPFLNQFALSDYASIPSRIAFRLINAASNQSLLKTMPHIPWLDLAIVFYLYIQENEDGIMTAAIYDHHIKTWGITVDDLYHALPLKHSQSFSSCLSPACPVFWSPSIPDTCTSPIAARYSFLRSYQ